ncbi:MAG: hypothetical protein KJS95_07800 [Gammaproteobacteria bacterium]|nr:hypothetical protein [Gammaproteobacteria bacterium]
MSDLALGIVVFVFAAVPASLLLLALADVIRLEGEGARRRWIRNCLWALAVPATVPLALGAWGAAGAAHLEPLCHAYATPEFRAMRAAENPQLLLDLQPSGKAPRWTESLSARYPGRVRIADDGRELPATHVLEVRRLTHHKNLWFTVEMQRFRLVEQRYGTVIAEGDELQIEAGRSRYHCGIESGPLPVSAQRTRWPGGDGVARFVVRGLSGPDAPLRP